MTTRAEHSRLGRLIAAPGWPNRGDGRRENSLETEYHWRRWQPNAVARLRQVRGRFPWKLGRSHDGTSKRKEDACDVRRG